MSQTKTPPVRKIPLLITKDATRKNVDQAAKKSTIERGRGFSPLTKRQEGRGYTPLTTIKEGRRYRSQKDKGNLGGNKLKIYPLRSKFLSKTESWKK